MICGELVQTRSQFFGGKHDLHDPETMPAGNARLNSFVTFFDEKTQKVREVQLVLPAEADFTEGRLHPHANGCGALPPSRGPHYRVADLNGDYRPIRVVSVIQPAV